MIFANFDQSFEGWRKEARHLLRQKVAPQHIRWTGDNGELFGTCTPPANAPTQHSQDVNVPKTFIERAEIVACARDEDRWDIMYRILYRMVYITPKLLHISVDADVRRFQLLYQSVRRDLHKMKAFVRFKKIIEDGVEMYVAWHTPEHRIIEKGAPFFVRRFGDKPWIIYTPDGSAYWDTSTLSFGAGIAQSQFPHTDEFDEVWKTYYKSIFNPARVMIKAMKKEFPSKYWASLPEATLIAELIRGAPAQLQAMARRQNTKALVDEKMGLAELKLAARSCKACPLYAKATHTVFGEGPANARVMIVGEQPGDQEDTLGRPFVGPAGELLNECLEHAGLPREQLYITNAVKHFKWIADGSTRLHKRASGSEMHACLPWLEAEIAQVRPDIIIALGQSAGTAILGRLPKLSVERGLIHRENPSPNKIILSWHPAAILRSRKNDEMTQKKQELIQDLRLAVKPSIRVHQLSSH